ncbi:MAG: TetR/AcrR family transcriptional regulator [Pseudomonadota bacterium]
MTGRSNNIEALEGPLNGYQRRRLETRHQLMTAGRRLFIEQGVTNVSIDAITRTAGVAKGSFYNHFDSREALFDALVGDIVADLMERRSRYDPPTQDPLELGLCRTWFAYYDLLSNPEACHLLLQAGSQRKGDVITGVLRQTIGDEMLGGIALGELSHLDPAVVHAAYFGMLLSTAGYLLGQGDQLDAQQGANQLTELTFAIFGLPYHPPNHYPESVVHIADDATSP